MTNAYLLTYLFTYLLTRWECPGHPKEIVEIPGWQTLAIQTQQLSMDPIEIDITRWWNQRRCFLYTLHRKLIRCPIKPTHYSWDHVYCSRCGRWWDVMVGGVLMNLWNRQRETAISNASKLSFKRASLTDYSISADIVIVALFHSTVASINILLLSL